jgi:hypothetical protein
MATKVQHRSAAAIAVVACFAIAAAACAPPADQDPAAAPDAPGVPAQPAAPGPPGATADSPDTPRPDEQVSPAAPAPDRDWTAGRSSREHQVTGVATLRAVRIAPHDAFERIVFEFASAAELPSYAIEYVDRPVRECGSGHVVELPGDAWLAIRFEPARGHDDEGRATITDRDRSPGFPLLLRLRTICDFEAHLDWVAAVSSPEPYAVMELRDPARLVVDLRGRR